MRIPCRLCRTFLDVTVADFNLVANFAGRFKTVGKFYCRTCADKLKMPAPLKIRGKVKAK